MNRKSAIGTVVVWGWIGSMLFAQSALEQLERRFFGPAEQPNAASEVRQPYLGFRGDTSIDGGVTVLSVDRGGPADAAGMRVGDVLTRFDTTQVAGLATLSRAVAAVRPGQSVPIRLKRGNSTISTNLRIGSAAATAPVPAVPMQKASLGVSVIPLTAAERARKRIPVRQGAMITTVSPGSGAARAGVKAGTVVIAVDGRRVERPEDLIGFVQTARVGQTVELTLYEGPVLRTKRVTLGPAGEPSTAAGGLESRLGDGGRRPVLGALGRLLDDVVGDRAAPLAGPLPPPTGAPPGGLAPGAAEGGAGGLSPSGTGELRLRADEAALLFEQLRALQAAVERLERRVEFLEGRPARLKPKEVEPESIPEPPARNPRAPLEAPVAPKPPSST